MLRTFRIEPLNGNDEDVLKNYQKHLNILYNNLYVIY